MPATQPYDPGTRVLRFTVRPGAHVSGMGTDKKVELVGRRPGSGVSRRPSFARVDKAGALSHMTIWALALRAAGASRTYRRAVPAANGWSGASGALESLDGNPYPPIRA